MRSNIVLRNNRRATSLRNKNKSSQDDDDDDTMSKGSLKISKNINQKLWVWVMFFLLNTLILLMYYLNWMGPTILHQHDNNKNHQQQQRATKNSHGSGSSGKSKKNEQSILISKNVNSSTISNNNINNRAIMTPTDNNLRTTGTAKTTGTAPILKTNNNIMATKNSHGSGSSGKSKKNEQSISISKNVYSSTISNNNINNRAIMTPTDNNLRTTGTAKTTGTAPILKTNNNIMATKNSHGSGSSGKSKKNEQSISISKNVYSSTISNNNINNRAIMTPTDNNLRTTATAKTTGTAPILKTNNNIMATKNSHGSGSSGKSKKNEQSISISKNVNSSTISNNNINNRAIMTPTDNNLRTTGTAKTTGTAPILKTNNNIMATKNSHGSGSSGKSKKNEQSISISKNVYSSTISNNNINNRAIMTPTDNNLRTTATAKTTGTAPILKTNNNIMATKNSHGSGSSGKSKKNEQSISISKNVNSSTISNNNINNRAIMTPTDNNLRTTGTAKTTGTAPILKTNNNIMATKNSHGSGSSGKSKKNEQSISISKNVYSSTISNNNINNRAIMTPTDNNLRTTATAKTTGTAPILKTNNNIMNMDMQKPPSTTYARTKPISKSSTTLKTTKATAQVGQISKKLGNLKCKTLNGKVVNETITKDTTYWNDIPMDLTYKSPYNTNNEPKYVTFEKDQAGWNNNRMAFENVILFAVATGRTLVVPPAQLFALMQERGHVYKRQKSFFSFEDLFNLDSIPGLKHVSTEEFLEKVAMKEQKLKSKKTKQVTFPKKTSYDNEDIRPLHQYLRDVGYLIDWKPRKCIGVFPSTPGIDGVKRMENVFNNIINKKDSGTDTKSTLPHPHQYLDKPTQVDASVKDRLREIMAERDSICIYNQTLQNEFLIHIQMELNFEKEIESYRWLVPYYSFLFFENWKVDLWAKRFIRDHVKYQDDIMCKAAMIVGKIKDRAKSRNPITNPNGHYYSFHIRRNDFQQQYDATSANATTILQLSIEYLPIGSTIFIATDEKEGDFFAPFHDIYDVLFLSDFQNDIIGDDINTNFYGMIDQIVASRSSYFIGTFLSTFTAYINRIRGYYSSRDKYPPGYDIGQLKNVIHFLPRYATKAMWQYQAVRQPFWNREFPVAWRDIDKGIVGSIADWNDDYLSKTMKDAAVFNNNSSSVIGVGTITGQIDRKSKK